MPNMAATALAPIAAAQIAAMVRPTAVAAMMIASGAPTALAGVTPTSARPRAMEPTMKLGSPSMAGSPANGPVAGTSATTTSSTTSSTRAPESCAVIAAPLSGNCQEPRDHVAHKASVPRPPPAADLSLKPAIPGGGPGRLSSPTFTGHYKTGSRHAWPRPRCLERSQLGWLCRFAQVGAHGVVELALHVAGRFGGLVQGRTAHGGGDVAQVAVTQVCGELSHGR